MYFLQELEFIFVIGLLPYIHYIGWCLLIYAGVMKKLFQDLEQAFLLTVQVFATLERQNHKNWKF
ncbi:hypothetical protein [Gloeocapsopsis sp. IPPAS B-1203]|uniref:hypothetical protein n=1 Tax=Gloeocapsopsis sp. IPPAS B-1203 TaxID=2049454 RepID=UPI000C1998E0|nr:hypothetical protein [Gloeocapsopsis sp. IPPAS B-1203]PIG94351.1 hypothetical protein CSQ79_03380 [Gloeocapsopsis sp. IPPAS B-1203]